ncbi:MAG: serine/threonine-protein kinase, partial [Gemmatirosa sp.]
MQSQRTGGAPATRDGVRLPGSCPQCRAEYEEGLQFCPRDGAPLRRARAGVGPAGEVIGDRYLVIREIDSGGMGRVYLAQHLRMGRQCAVKIMHRALLDDESAQARFNREAESASRINHPNVATIYDFGETKDGTAYLAMEYVAGESLRALLERDGPLPPMRASAIVSQIASGLDAAHELPIVHRDLKPDNVMVTRHRDGGDAVKLVDFGIAKSVAGDAGAVTALGSVVGTPDYMAPEQAAGKPVDARADVYALGLVAFHLLTASLAFAGETPADRMLMRLSEPPRTLAAARPDVAWPRPLQSVLDRALARDPAARYQSAGALGQDFAAAIADWQREPRRRPWRRTAEALRKVVVVLPTRVLRGGDDGRALLGGVALLCGLGAATIIALGGSGQGASTGARAPAPTLGATARAVALRDTASTTATAPSAATDATDATDGDPDATGREMLLPDPLLPSLLDTDTGDRRNDGTDAPRVP